MKIKYLGHASFLLTAADGTSLQFDPFEPGGYDGALDFKPFVDEADIVAVSHDHADHAFVEGVPGRPEIIKGPQDRNLKGIQFTRHSSFHDMEKGSARGENIITVCEIDGVRVCHLGDQGQELSPREIDALGAVDVLMIPVGGTFTIDATQATRVMEAIAPRVCIPMHYKTPKVGFPLAPVKEFLRGKDRVKEVGRPEAEITAETLPDKSEVWVFETAL